MKVIVVGAGYVGLVAAACLSKSGHNVLCVEKDAGRYNKLKTGVIPIYEPGLEELVLESVEKGNLRFENDLHNLDGEVLLIAVGTPSLPDGRVDLSQVYNLFEVIIEKAKKPLVVIMKSTVPPGLGEKIKKRYINRTQVNISYISNPEFLREGQAIYDWYNPDRIVVGGDEEEAIEKILNLYSDIDAPKCSMDITSAEMVKYTSNAFLATKISFINEIANLCDQVGADILPVSQAVGMDHRIGEQFLKAGLGYGGSCFPKDTRGLYFVSTFYGQSFNLLKAVIEVNRKQRILAIRKLIEFLGELNGKKIGILGVAFKPNTDDTREGPALDIISMLLDEGASITAYDPVVKRLPEFLVHKVAITNDYIEVAEGANALIVCTEWPEIIAIDWGLVIKIMQEPKMILDGRNCLPQNFLKDLGFNYLGMGRR